MDVRQSTGRTGSCFDNAAAESFFAVLKSMRGAIGRGLPFAWVAADADYGKDPALRALLHESALSYVLGIPVTLPVVDPPRKPYQPAVAKAGDLLHYAIVRDR